MAMFFTGFVWLSHSAYYHAVVRVQYPIHTLVLDSVVILMCLPVLVMFALCGDNEPPPARDQSLANFLMMRLGEAYTLGFDDKFNIRRPVEDYATGYAEGLLRLKKLELKAREETETRERARGGVLQAFGGGAPLYIAACASTLCCAGRMLGFG